MKRAGKNHPDPARSPSPNSRYNAVPCRGKPGYYTIALGADKWSSPRYLDFRSATTKRSALRWFVVAVRRLLQRLRFGFA